MIDTFEEEVANAKTLIDVLLLLKKITMLDTHVATLARPYRIIKEYDEESGYGICECKPFPLEKDQDEYLLQAYYFTADGNPDKEDPTKGLLRQKFVVILFMDRNFINSIKAVDETPKKTNDRGLHLLKYGVIIKTY